ncbi:hypothetical protein B0H13DRAFT_1600360, partial [Mycena leptocephala]
MVFRLQFLSLRHFKSDYSTQLSGIGDREHLVQYGIFDLPGVGSNLQDHGEVSNICILKHNHTLFDDCTLIYTPEEDPCLKFWTD